jgi:serine protease Do
MPNQQQANAETGSATPSGGVPHLGLTVAPASAVPGAGASGVVVVAVDPNSLAAEEGFKTGVVILDVGGRSVANAADVRSAMAAAKGQGKHDVLLRVKMDGATRFVALPLDNA